jgi:uncharacterized heparinase superfamily protein
VERGSDRWRLYRLALHEAGRRAAAVARRLARRVRLRTAVPERLLFAPPDLRTSEPTIATDIYGGDFVFAGRTVSTGGRSPFSLPPPSRGWGEALYGFGWLRHLRAADTVLARTNARALVDEFLSNRWARGDRELAYQTHVTARRLVAFLSHSPMILADADHAFYRRFMRALGTAIRQLSRAAREDAVPQRRLAAAIALAYAGLCCRGFGKVLRRATRILAGELERQILPDGGHASRNPQVLVDLLLELVPLRQTYASRGVEPPEALMRAIERMLPMVRLFRHRDGTLALFNGMGFTALDNLATLLSYDHAKAQPIQHAPHSGYERLQSAGALVIADVGAPPPLAQSGEAHAGCLSFEFSSDVHQIVVNCGTPRGPTEPVAQLARSTAAHSTAVVSDLSSCQFLRPEGWPLQRRIAGWLMRQMGPVILSGPHEVVSRRGESDGALILSARHDGYRKPFGIVHERRWNLSAGGERLDGEDLFTREREGAAPAAMTLRFHLHPTVRPKLVQNARVVMLVLPRQEVWQFEAEGHAAAIEESIYFAASDGRRRTEQIVVALDPGSAHRVPWRFERLSPARA